MATSIVQEILRHPLVVADAITKVADEATSFKQECLELKSKAERLATLMRQTARNSNDLYERPTRRIIEDTEQVLDKAYTLVTKCRTNTIIKRLFTIIPTGAFKKITLQLENSIGNVSWLLRVSANASEEDDQDEYLGLPPIAANEPILCMIWEQIAILYTGSLDDRSDAAASLVSLARDSQRYPYLIIEEGGVVPLLKLVKEGKMEGQEQAAHAIGLLGRDPESVEHIVNAGVCSVFAKILKEGHMKVQAKVAWAVSVLAKNYPKCQDPFAQNNIIRLLVSHLAFETVQEHSKYTIASKQQMTIHSILMASNNNNNSNSNSDTRNQIHEEKIHSSSIRHPLANQGHGQNPNQMHNLVTDTMTMKTHSSNGQHAQEQQQQQKPISIAGTSIKGREFEDPITKADLKAMSARALWRLCMGNISICRSITESRALLCFAVLLAKGPDEVQEHSAMALMEITAVAEQNSDLRRSAFKPTAPAAKAVVDQLLKIIEKGDSTSLLIPCIRAVGFLNRTFRATETRFIAPLVKLLEEREVEIMTEAVLALNKFACPENFLHANHARAIVDAGGVKSIVQLVYFGEQMIQVHALTLMCYIALHVPDSEVLTEEEVLILFEWASKQSTLNADPKVEALIADAIGKLRLFNSRGARYL